MADLGAIGRIVEESIDYLTPRGPWGLSGGVLLSGVAFPLITRWNEGNPTAPAERQDRQGRGATILWPVEAGDRTFTIRVRARGTPTARIILKANPGVGITEDVAAEATSAEEWQELQVSITVVAPGVLEVWREIRAQAQNAYAIWDHIVVG